MGPHFHLLDNKVFSARIPGDAPTDADRKKFKSPKLEKGMLERDIYAELGAVIQSVLKVAKCKKVGFLDTANHKTCDGNHGRIETFNGAGIYRDTTLARMANDLDSQRRASSKMSKEQLKNRCLGARAFWVDVPIVVKGDEKDSAFYFKSKPRESWTDCMHPSTSSSLEQAEEGEDVEEMEEEEDDEGGDEEGEEEEDDEDDEEEEDEDAEDSFEDDIEDLEGVEENENFESEGENSGPPEETEHPTLASDPAVRVIKKSFPPFVNLSDNGLKALGQFVEHQLNVFKYQHRTFCYSIYVCFDMARLLYFDRAGAFVSEPFSWVEPTSLLHEFVWKFAKLANANKLGDMGHDTTAKVVSLGTRRKFLKEAQNPALAAHIMAGLKKAAANDCPLYELTVEDVSPSPDEWFPDEPFPERSSSRPSPSGSSSSNDSTSEPTSGSAPSTRRFIVGRPHFSSDALVGRCTKGYMAFDVTNPKKWVPCFLKDSWRPYVRGRTRPEHLVYERLRRMNVEKKDGVATLICGGDVGGSYAQCTRVQEDLPCENRPALRVHYRLVVEDIGVPLTDFYNFGDLSAIFADALRAHYKAFKRAKVLHHDISVGNIMIRIEDGRQIGFLIDWELSRLESELGNGPVKPDRTGTWQFRSALSLQYPRKPYRRSDDIESFIHVYLYLVLRYHHTRVAGVKDLAERLFEQASLVGGVKVGGDAKFAMMVSGTVPFRLDSNKPLQSLLSKLMRGCSHAYSRLDLAAMDRSYGPDRTPRPHASNSSNSDSDSSPPARAGARHASDDEMSQSSDAEELEKVLRRVREDQTHRAPTTSTTADLCKTGTFLSSPRILIDLFSSHSQNAENVKDKMRDQFSSNVGFVAKKRGRSQPASEAECGSADNEQAGSSSRRRVKRLKVEGKGKVAQS